jgi:hypothetical protein
LSFEADLAGLSLDARAPLADELHTATSAHVGAVLASATTTPAVSAHRPGRSAEPPAHAAASNGSVGFLRPLLLLLLLVGAHRVWRRYKRWRIARDAERAALQGSDTEEEEVDGRLSAEERIRRELREANLLRQQRAGGEQAHKALSSLLADSVFADLSESGGSGGAGFGAGLGDGLGAGFAPGDLLRLPASCAKTSPPRGRLYDQHRMRFEQAWPLSEEDSAGAVSSDSDAQAGADTARPRAARSTPGSARSSRRSKDIGMEGTAGEQEEARFFGAPAQALDDFEQRVVAQCM